MSSIAGTQHALCDFSEWLDGLRDGDGLWRGDVRSAALRLALLPLYIVREGFYGLRADGAVMLARWQEDPVEVSDVRARVRAIAQAAHQFPALKELLPARPEGALTCSRCRGSGIAPNQTGVACDCDGLGWQPRESA
ncbi:MAG: hypothetical protein ACJ790_20655 [Myxococcaceae bacterium]